MIADTAEQLELTLNPVETQQLCSLPYLLATVYGAPYLWQALADVLHRRALGVERFVANAASRMQSLARQLPSAYRKLRMEVLFYLVFRSFMRTFHDEIAICRSERKGVDEALERVAGHARGRRGAGPV